MTQIQGERQHRKSNAKRKYSNRQRQESKGQGAVCNGSTEWQRIISKVIKIQEVNKEMSWRESKGTNIEKEKIGVGENRKGGEMSDK